MSDSRADHLLCCAVSFFESSPEGTKPTNVFDSVEDAVQSMRNVLLFEANRSLCEQPKPDEPNYNPVDLGTEEPGILHKKETIRRKMPLPPVVYKKRKVDPEPVSYTVDRPRSLDDAAKVAEKQEMKALKALQRRATRDIKSDKKAIDRIEAAAEKKRQRQEESPEDRESRLSEQRANRAEKKAQKALDNATESNEAPDLSNDCKDEDVEEEGGDNEDNEQPDENIKNQLETIREIDKPCHALLPQRIRVRQSKSKYYPSVVPFDRHLESLGMSELHPNVKESVLRGLPSEHVRIIQGPPGTGKTTYIVNELLPQWTRDRIFVCAPTNVGAANIYSRLVQTEPFASLVMAPSRIPVGTVVTSQDPGARIVCSTISARAGPLLDSEKFGVVIVDEAAQCMEAWMWCLLRREVHTVIMVGDTNQLPALVSQDGEEFEHGRSLMQRLCTLEYPSLHLDTQRRMHEEIVKFPNESFYGGNLKTLYDSTNVYNTPPYLIIDVNGKCEPYGTSWINTHEADVCEIIVKELQETFTNIVVICPYQAQVREFLHRGIERVHSIDSFQGHEADAVVVSMVRTNNIGFWSDVRRLNVALTRAKHCLRIVGASSQWSGVLKTLADDAERRGLLVSASDKINSE